MHLTVIKKTNFLLGGGISDCISASYKHIKAIINKISFKIIKITYMNAASSIWRAQRIIISITQQVYKRLITLI